MKTIHKIIDGGIIVNLERLHEIIRKTTVQLRKGEAVEEHQTGNIHTTEVFAMPHEDQVVNDGIKKVDCHFIVVGVDKIKAEHYRDELFEILKTYPEPDRLAGGPSYIEMGRMIGDQGAAFQLFAIGQVLGFWEVITPKTMGFTGPFANQMAGSGMVMISGFSNNPT